MNERDPYESYLHLRAEGLELPGAGAPVVAERARARRRRRRAGAGAALGVAVLLGGTVVGQGLRPERQADEVASDRAAEAASALDWTLVSVKDGLGSATDMVIADSGTAYALSTTAGGVDQTVASEPVVYSSPDGSEWTAVEIPEDIRVQGLAADGDTIYAVGTAALGGSIRVASSGADGGWDVTDLPLDLEAESAELHGKLYVADLDVAAGGGTTLVGVKVGLDPAVGDLVSGQIRVFARSDHAGPAESGEPDPTSFRPVTGIPDSMGGQILAGPDGFWSVTAHPGSSGQISESGEVWTEARYSPDGYDWSGPPISIPGEVVASGVLDGAPQLLTVKMMTGSVDLIRLVGGSAPSMESNAVLGPVDGQFLSGFSISPVGVTLVTASESGDYEVLHSVDGKEFDRTEIPVREAGEHWYLDGITSMPDSVKVRLSSNPSSAMAGGATRTQWVFVGTPR